mmetsp:Transcript_28971/g.71551  ORF Transcript_28971/g.71551 Transcript_28971/m.71551 type:complete len:832 (-) Transcript_28971:120-2615(-)|eukprot:CAMPEP_0197614728 /NCGR_PEP_ID=MMETSP1326-20131121/59673_1 /TAXON_ID=1155430 /ORGANISM="Genus nov. species nov., Strain RCC2288" /LENGTH=831 /DNA_ID=CAMNT_0043183605 /DNA_START=2094 /DNA_END=4589 /DNA_ORIENTATION=+
MWCCIGGDAAEKGTPSERQPSATNLAPRAFATPPSRGAQNAAAQPSESGFSLTKPKTRESLQPSELQQAKAANPPSVSLNVDFAQRAGSDVANSKGSRQGENRVGDSLDAEARRSDSKNSRTSNVITTSSASAAPHLTPAQLPGHMRQVSITGPSSGAVSTGRRFSDNGSDAGSENSASTSSSSVRQYEVTKHTGSVTKSSVKMGEVEYSQFNQYIIIKDLGRGAHAKVMLGLNTADNLLYAIKVTNSRAAVAETAVRKEIAVLKKLNHNNVLKLYEVIDDVNSNELLLVLEYASCGPVFTRYNRLPVQEAVLHSYTRDIILGLDYLHHAVGIAHMDLKPENLLKSADGTVKIADFGVSFIGQTNTSNSQKRIVGTPAFIAPEMIDDVGYDPYIADIWSLGICLFHMATAQLPFIGKTVFQIIAMAKRQGLQFPPLPRLSNNLMDLIISILDVNPNTRTSVSQIMSHPWITSDGEMPMPASLADQPTQILVTDEEVAMAIRADPLAAFLRPVFKIQNFAPGDFIMRKGERGDRMYFINSGVCEVLMDALDSGDTGDGGSSMSKGSGDAYSHNLSVLAVRTAGQFIGELAVLECIEKGDTESVGKRTASVRARGQVECLSVTVDEMLLALDQDEGGRDRLVRTASFRLEQNEEIVRQLAEIRQIKPVNLATKEVVLNPVRTLQVLYAEDSVPTQFIVKRLMKRLGNVQLMCANDGKAALEYCERCARGEVVRPDIILMDCQMPVMDGLEATSRIRQLADDVSHVPIVAVSSGIKSMNQSECMEAGMDDYVAKPLNQETLADVLIRNLPPSLLHAPSAGNPVVDATAVRVVFP